MKIFFSVGEPSGDLHGANLIRELRRRRPRLRVRRLRRAADGRGRLPAARRPHQAGRDVVCPRALEPASLLEPGEPGRSLLPPPSAGRGRADRLPRLQLVDRPAGQGARHSGVLLRRAAALGLGRLAGARRCGGSSTTCSASCRSRRRGIASAAATPRSSAIRISTSSAANSSTRTFIERQRAGGGPLVAILPGSRTQEVKSNFG